MKALVALAFGSTAIAEKIIHVTISNNMTSDKALYFARGSSSCWGLPGLAPQEDGSINVVPDEGNLACPCNDSDCDYYSHLYVPLYLDSKWDIFHRNRELIGQVKFAGLGKKTSAGDVKWQYKCEIEDAEAGHAITCQDAVSPDPSLYFKAYQVSLRDAAIAVAAPKPETMSFLDWVQDAAGQCNCFNTCLCKDWDCCCNCNDCRSDPGVAPHCTGSSMQIV